MEFRCHKHHVTVLTAIIIFLNIHTCCSKIASYEYIESSEISSIEPSSLIFSDVSGDGLSAKEFAISSPTQSDGSAGTVKRKRIIRRRKKVNPSATLAPTTEKKASTAEPSVFKIFKLEEPPLVLENKETNDSEVQPHKRPQKKSHHHKINHDVWKATTLALNDEVLNQGESDSDISQVGKRDSGEKRNITNSSGELSPDLHTEESNNAYVNSSTPISNELQNSLQFTLQILHPLLNSDTILSEGSLKTPENKTVHITHMLSDNFAQTPIAHELGFVPTNLRKKHPLLNHDSIFSSHDGASKTGILTNVHPPVQSQTVPYLKSDSFTTSMKPTTGHQLTTPSTPVVTISLSTASTPTTQGSKSQSTRRTTSSVSKSTQKITVKPQLVSTGTTSTTVKAYTTTVTTSLPPRSSEIPSPISTVKSSSTPSIFTTSKPTTNSNFGVLNITEVTTESHSSSSTSSDIKPPYSSIIEMIGLSTTENNLSSILSTSTRGTTQSPSTKINGFTQGSKDKESSASLEATSAERLLIEQLLGIGAGAPADSPLSIPSQGDSNELLQLFSLVQNQSQNKRNNPVTPPSESLTINQAKSSSENIPNIFETLLLQPKPQHSSTSTTTASTPTSNPQQIPESDLANLRLLQALLNPQTNSGASSGPQLDLETLLSLASQDLTSSSVPPTITSSSQAPSSGEGLSDADLKSIFALLDSQTLTSTTTTTTSTTTTTPTTTTTTTTTPKPTVAILTQPPVRGPLTTTLHPALQSMLDLFNNQLKPFQSIPSPSAPVAASPSEPRQNILPPVITSTQPPPTKTFPTLPSTTTTTQNSLDLLSQLLNFGSPQGTNKVNSVRSNPLPNAPAATPEFSLASLFGGSGNTNNNLFSSNFLSPQPPSPSQAVPDSNTQSGSNQLLNYFGGSQSSFLQPSTTPAPPSGLYYWLDLNAFLGGDPKADPMSGIRPKMGYKHPFIKVN